MPQCMQLSTNDVSSLVANGWTQVGGPFDSMDECNANCGSSSSSSSSASSCANCVSACGCSQVPQTLHATITSATCSLINGTVIVLTYNSMTQVWSGNNGGFITFSLQCTGSGCSSFVLTYECGLSFTLNTSSCSCNPFSLSYSGPANEGGTTMCGFCPNGSTFTVTIVP